VTSIFIPASAHVEEWADDPAPRRLVVGARIVWGLAALGALGLVVLAVVMTTYRYGHDDTAMNFAGPLYALLVLVIVAAIGFSLYAMRSANETVRGNTAAWVRLVGLGAGAVVASAIVAWTLFAKGAPLGGAVAIVWAVLVLAALGVLSSGPVNAWFQTRSPWFSVLRWIRENLIAFAGLLVMAYLYIPNAVVAAMSFNHAHAKRTIYQWSGFTMDNWKHVCAPAGMCDSVQVSLLIGVIATIVATIVGTLAAFAMVRHRFAGRTSSNVVIFLPMATPEIVMGSSLLAFFVALHLGGHLGRTTIVIAHVMFCLSYVITTVKARLAGMDSTLEQAAMDLYADERTTFMKVTLPLVFPGILAAALLSFSLSFDDYIITNLNAGTTTTFPMYVWGAAQRGLPMQVNVIGTFMFVLAIVIVATGELLGRRRSRGVS
jgi:spermidine/putrescine transport system permease protein